MGAKGTGWWRIPVVEKVTGWLAGGVALPGMEVVGSVHLWSRGEGSEQGEGRG